MIIQDSRVFFAGLEFIVETMKTLLYFLANVLFHISFLQSKLWRWYYTMFVSENLMQYTKNNKNYNFQVFLSFWLAWKLNWEQ